MKIILIGILAISAGTCIAIGAEKPAEFFNETQKTTTLFSFDDVSIPFTENLKLEMRTPERHSDNPVVNRGPEGSVDSWAVQFYGSVLRDHETGKFRMWYAAVSKEERKAASKEKESSRPWRVAYAESDDGVNWTKPKLGLVEALGNKDNNLCLLEPHLGVLNLKVLDEPNDPNPAHRFKLGAHVWTPKSERRRNGTLAPYVSADGYTWKLLGDAEPVKSARPEADTYIPPLHFEPVGGLYKWDGLYHLSGQNAISATVPYHGRVSRTFISPDFKNWSQGSAIQAVRAHQHELLGPGKSRIGEQTHEGISVWNRGNVLVGVSGIWHGTPEWKDLTIDLGFVVSNDGTFFREPMKEWTFIQRGEDGAWDQGGLLQAQGFENVGEKTYVYYGGWDPRSWESSPPRGGVGIVTVPRDRFADLVTNEVTKGSGDYQMEETVCSFMTSSLNVEKAATQLFINATGLGKKARLRVELLDHLMKPIQGYSREDAAIVEKNGFQTPLVFGGKPKAEGLPKRVRIKTTFEGEKRTGIRFSALYLR